MGALVVVIALLDAALGLLLVAVSGFVLQGVNNTGPVMPNAIVYVVMTVLCFVAPAFAMGLKRRATVAAGLTTSSWNGSRTRRPADPCTARPDRRQAPPPDR